MKNTEFELKISVSEDNSSIVDIKVKELLAELKGMFPTAEITSNTNVVI